VVRKLLRVALAVPLLAIGLGAASAAAHAGPATPLCAQAASANHVGIVVEHGDGTVIRGCVSFTTPTITALDVLHDSGIQYSTASYGGSLGEAVCQIDNEPAQYTECLPSSGSYWVFFVATSSGTWTNSPQGVSRETVSDGDAVGFRYDPLAGADPAPASPAGTCPVSTPTPTPTAAPTASAAPTPFGTPRASGTPNAAGSTPAGGSAVSNPDGTSSPPSSDSATPTGQVAGVLGVSSPSASPAAVLGASNTATAGTQFNPALVIAVVAVATLIGLLGFQGLRRRRQ
jgi:hypothetical protein